MVKDILLRGVVLSAFLISLLLAPMAGAGDIGETLKSACSRCHSTKRVCLNVGVKDAAAWKATVSRMVGKGAQLPADRIDEAASYLSGLEAGTGPVCE